MISSTIKKRTQEVNKQIKEKWCQQWMEYITQHPEHPWVWSEISQNENLTMDYVERHPEHPWNWYGISQNENLTMDYVERHPEHPWHWHWISQNENLTMDYVKRHPQHPWTWHGISQNVFKKDRQQLIEKTYKEHLSAFTPLDI
jgi:hypothetical protein